MVAAGEIIHASDISALDARLALFEGGFTLYTPVWTATGTAPAIGNGQLVGSYKLLDKQLTVRGFWQAGSTTTFGTGTYAFSTPAAAPISAGISAQIPHYGAWLRDTAPGVDYSFFALLATSTSVQFRQVGSGTNVLFTATTPVAVPANGDWFAWECIFQAA